MILPQTVMAKTNIPTMYVYFVYTAMSCMQKLLYLHKKGKNIGHFDETFFSFYVYSAVRVCSVSIVFSSN